jgi:hypothetical protein
VELACLAGLHQLDGVLVFLTLTLLQLLSQLVLPLHAAHESHAPTIAPLLAAQAHTPESSCLFLPIQHLSGMLGK